MNLPLNPPRWGETPSSHSARTSCRARRSLASLGLLLLIAAAGATAALRAAEPSATPAEVLRPRVEAEATRALPELEPLYRHFHQHPELSLQEAQTATRVADELERLGFAVTRRVGGHGVVGVLANGRGPTILVRTDLDALPLREQTGAPYASATEGVMHACGHDMHMTVFLGTARVLSKLKAEWQGTLMMIGQPAEEKVQGARAMLADGLYTRFPRPDYCVALHCAADLPAGHVGVTEGYALANVNSVDILVRGVGGHGAWPHKTKDPIVLSAQIILALQTIVSRETEPTQPAVVTVGSIHGGTKHNIIPDEVRLQLTLRSYSNEVREHTLAAIRRMVRGLAEAAGLPEDRYPVVTVADESASATYNDPELCRRLMTTFKSWLGPERTTVTKPTMGAEDFGLFGRVEPNIPSCIFWLGTVDPARFAEHRQTGEPLPPLHSSGFLPAIQPTLQTGIVAMTAAVLELLGAGHTDAEE